MTTATRPPPLRVRPVTFWIDWERVTIPARDARVIASEVEASPFDFGRLQSELEQAVTFSEPSTTVVPEPGADDELLEILHGLRLEGRFTPELRRLWNALVRVTERTWPYSLELRHGDGREELRFNGEGRPYAIGDRLPPRPEDGHNWEVVLFERGEEGRLDRLVCRPVVLE